MRLKRVFDTVVSFVGLVLFLPLFLVVGLVIRLTSNGPVFFKHRRVGKDGKEIVVLKFRTMATQKIGPVVTAASDRRITPIGAFMRRFKIDELPQLINVLKGDMSLVGPRPEIPELVATYTPEMRRLLTVRPGITSLASLIYRNEEKIIPSGVDVFNYHKTVLAPAKATLDLKYIEMQSLKLDLQLIVHTVLGLKPPAV